MNDVDSKNVLNDENEDDDQDTVEVFDHNRELEVALD